MFDYLRLILTSRLGRLDDRGASAVEYALIVASVALVIAGVTAGFVVVLQHTFTHACNQNAATGTTC